ncbi:phage baseplate protein [Natroniella sp. ANB-PHB2]|uniref:phage baseplate protein n=1 Tax=Natroniella sp. ANB-PHB2 TaxID=3384444 RepID=UPI0038D4007C
MANLSEDTTIGGKKIKDLIAEMTYPVGSWYYNSEDNTNPAELLGFGEWQPVAAGKVPVGVDPNDSDFNSVEKTGGEKEVNLSENEMPSHSHSVSEDTTGSHDHNPPDDEDDLSGSRVVGNLGSHDHDIPAIGANSTDGGSYWEILHPSNTTKTSSVDLFHRHMLHIEEDGLHNHNTSVNNAGGGQAHNNLQPYITVYIWKRVG